MDNKSKSTYIIAAVFLILFLAAVYFLFIFKKGPAQIKPKAQESFDVKPIWEIDIAKRPYITLTPTSNGAEIILSIENMKEFERVEYELTYQADNPTSPGTKIERGAVGSDINPKDEKYKKSLLLGTASRGVSSSDTGITGGKLTMHLYIGPNEYLSESSWDLQQIGAKAAILKSQDGNFELNIPSLGKDYYVILADTVGVPQANKTFDLKNVKLPVYGVFSVAGDFTKEGSLTIKSEDKSSVFSYNHSDSSWKDLKASYNSQSNLITAITTKFTTFVVVTP